MHRLSTLPGSDPEDDFCLVQQESAPFLFLTSAATDIATLDSFLKRESSSSWSGNIRALSLVALNHPAQIDHYIETTISQSQVVVVRLIGSRGHWSYGLEQLEKWQSENLNRQLIILSGTNDMDKELCPISSVDELLAIKLSELLREGGIDNMSSFLEAIREIAKNKKIEADDIEIKKIGDPVKWDWQDENGEKVGVIYYKSLFQSDDLHLPIELNKILRQSNLSPRVLFVSSLKGVEIQKAVYDLFRKDSVSVILTTTSFNTSNNDMIIDSSLWKSLNIPVLQLLISTKSKKDWINSSVGLNSLDLTLQIVLPEIDGRITTRPCAFREWKYSSQELGTVIHRLKPNSIGLNWVVNHTRAWINLQKNKVNKSICITLANYPIKNGRIANGVGLDTPESTVEILKLLKRNNYFLGDFDDSTNGKDLIDKLLASRTNDPETAENQPLDYITLHEYKLWWNTLPSEAKEPIINKWGYPDKAIDLVNDQFPIHGISYGDVSILIQPSRGYEIVDVADLHCPTLYPPHRYLAQYVWAKYKFKTDVMIHMGKHGSLEWLPGKSIGLSEKCAPQLAIDSIPNIYPFIVNDPGEGSQAKRRSQAVIIDHMTPPLGRAGLHSELITIEALLDEYYEARLLGATRSSLIKDKLTSIINSSNLIDVVKPNNYNKTSDDKESLFDLVDSYLCELKESQIRLGLHVFGKAPNSLYLLELLLCLARSPNSRGKGITQTISKIMGFSLDPWADNESELLQPNDREIIKQITQSNHFRKKGDLVDWIEKQALLLLKYIFNDYQAFKATSIKGKLNQKIRLWADNNSSDKAISYIKEDLWPKLVSCASSEQRAILDAISGKRIESGPSGAPTRGRPEVLPTGRNFYSMDLRGLPTETAWDVGRRSANNILELYLQENGEHLKDLALSVWGTSTMRNGGEDISQLFALLGVSPVWDGPSRRMIDLEVIPLNVLNRPRVDVRLRISGFFRDAFPQLIFWVDKAHRIIAALDESKEMNPYASKVRLHGHQARIFGSAPGSYGAGLQELINSGNWETRQDIANAYISWSKWRYDGNNEPTIDEIAFTQALKGIQVVVHNQDNREHDILDSDDYYQFHGGLGAAVELATGKKPDLLISDNSRIERPKVHTLNKEIDKVMRTRVLNPRWIEGMKSHSYKGAFEMGATMDYLFGYDAATDCVPDWCYSSIVDIWLNDQNTLMFLTENNPWVLRDIGERLLEAKNRNLWKSASEKEIEYLKSIILKAESIIEKS